MRDRRLVRRFQHSKWMPVSVLVSTSALPHLRYDRPAGITHMALSNGDRLGRYEILPTITADAAERGLTSLELEGGLALGQVEIADGDPAGRKRLEALANDAEQRGCLLIVRKAQEAMTG